MQYDNTGFLTFLFPIFLVQPFKRGQKLKTFFFLADTLLSQTMCAHRPICQHTVAARIDYYCWRILGYPIKKQREGLCSTGCIIFFYVAPLDRLSFATAQYCTHTYRFKEILQKYLIEIYEEETVPWLFFHQSTIYRYHGLGQQVQALGFHCESTEKHLEEEKYRNNGNNLKKQKHLKRTQTVSFNREKSSDHVLKKALLPLLLWILH